MLFPSEVFLFIFLPFVLAIYYLVLRKHTKSKNIFLFVMSLLFYAYGEPKYVFLMLFMILFHYFLGLCIEKYHSKWILVFMTIADICVLGYFKYLNFIVSIFTGNLNTFKIALPIGISFYTFQAISYVVDVYRGKGKVQTNFLNVGLYISLFPQLIAGPIVRYETIEKEIEHRKETINDFCLGVTRFIIGLGKKVLLANKFAIVADAVFAGVKSGSTTNSFLFLWLGAISYTLQIFFDFAGYSDMAIGLGRMFGFHFLENFNYPYIAQSITEFWRRWHISLSSWFRDYVYIPLGGSRCGKKKLVRNILIIWMLTGFWHGASWNFIVWGLLFGVLLAIEKLVIGDKIEKIPKVIRHLYVLFVVMISFIIFNSNDIISAFHNISGLFGGGGEVFINDVCLYYLNSYGLILLMACFGATPICKNLVEKISKNKTGKKIINILEPVYLGVLLLIVTTYLIDGSYNPFLYFRF